MGEMNVFLCGKYVNCHHQRTDYVGCLQKWLPSFLQTLYACIIAMSLCSSYVLEMGAFFPHLQMWESLCLRRARS
jgi:hypothetical protein